MCLSVCMSTSCPNSSARSTLTGFLQPFACSTCSHSHMGLDSAYVEHNAAGKAVSVHVQACQVFSDSVILCNAAV